MRGSERLAVMKGPNRSSGVRSVGWVLVTSYDTHEFGNDTQFGLRFTKPRWQAEKDQMIQLAWNESEGKSIRPLHNIFFQRNRGVLERYARRFMKT